MTTMLSAQVCAIGIDPGPVTGLALAAWDHGTGKVFYAMAVQCDHGSAPVLAKMMLSSTALSLDGVTLPRWAGGIEEFRSSHRSVRLTRPHDGNVTGELVTALSLLAAGHGVALSARSAAAVKPWATDQRLMAAGLFAVTAGQGHARDAARHALYAACHDARVPDPLSKKAAVR